MWMTKIEFMSPEYDDCVRLRYDVLRKPLKMEFDEGQLKNEYKDILIACYDNNYSLIGCLVLSPVDNKTLKMRQVAVAPNSQGRGVGRSLTAYSEAIANDLNCTKIYCHARKTAQQFYSKMGYKTVGKEFKEIGIPHFKMEKLLT